MRRPLTARTVAALKPGEWARDVRPRGAGQLEARRLASGVAWYYRHTGATGQQERVPLGTDLSLADARSRASELSRRYQDGERDLRRPAAPPRVPATLGALLTTYAESLAGRASGRAVLLSVRRNVEVALPELWGRPAGSLTLDDLLPIVSRLVRAGTLREAAKVRSYLRAAYAAAIRARQDAAAPDALRAFGISANPARDIATIDGATQPRGRTLPLSDLRTYWQHASPMAKFHLLTGGQRVAQLCRATVADIDRHAAMMRLLDGKGRRRQPRTHWVPLTPPAMEAMGAMGSGTLGPYILTANEGATAASYDAVHGAIRAAGDAASLASVTPGVIRATVETVLAAAGVPDETRAHLQSHGLGGIQTRHYNMHNYAAEKREALELLHRLLSD